MCPYEIKALSITDVSFITDGSLVEPVQLHCYLGLHDVTSYDTSYSWVIPMPPMTAGAKAFFFICILSAVLLYDTNHTFLFVLSLLNTILYFWSLGTMDNFARQKYRDLGVDQMNYLPEWMAETAHQRAKDAVPNWLATINFLCAFLSVGLLSYGIFVHL